MIPSNRRYWAWLLVATMLCISGASSWAATEVVSFLEELPNRDSDLLEIDAEKAEKDRYTLQIEEIQKQAKKIKNSHRVALWLLRAFEMREHLSSLVPLVRFYNFFATNKSTPAEIRSLSRYLLAKIERSRGRIPEMSEQMQHLGFVQQFWIAGPFDNENKGGCNVAYTPENEIDFSARFMGKAREIGWRRLPALNHFQLGYVDLGRILDPSEETVAYALATVDSDSFKRAIFHLGASGATRLWVNGEQVLYDDKYHAPWIDQMQAEVTLRPGSNQVLLKLCQNRGKHGFYLRVSNKRGDALSGVRYSAPDSLSGYPKGLVKAKPVPSLTDYFERRAAALPHNAKAQAEYAKILSYYRTFDEQERLHLLQATKALQLSPKDAELQNMVAEMSLPFDFNESRRYWEAILESDSGRLEASYALAKMYMKEFNFFRALAVLSPTLEKWPKDCNLALLEIDLLNEVGLSASSQKKLKELAHFCKHRPLFIRKMVREAKRQGLKKTAVAYLRVAIALRYDDLAARRSLVELLVDLGQINTALQELENLLRIDPWNVWAWVRQGELASSNGFSEKTDQAWAQAIKLAVDRAPVYQQQAKALAWAGNSEAAIESLNHALYLKPQDSQVKQLRNALKAEKEGFGEKMAFDVKKLIQENLPKENEDAVVLGDFTAVRVFSNGLASRFKQKVVRVQTSRGVQNVQTQWINFAPSRQDLKIIRAQIIKPDGSIIKTNYQSQRSLSDESVKLYYDTRAQQIFFPDIAPGDVLELAYRLDDIANDNLLSDYFGDLESIQGEMPKAHFEYVLSAPKGREIYSNKPSLGMQKIEELLADGTRIYRWKGNNIPKLVVEPGMPARSEVSPLLHVSTYSDWDSVGKYYWGLVREQLTPTSEIRQALRDITKNISPNDKKEIIRAVYDFVVSKTRYVGLEFGIHGFKPYKVDKILARQFGDCKDKASLMYSLLQVAGIESRLVLLRMRRLGHVEPQPASLAIFDHAILYIPEYDLWLDGTAQRHGSSELPYQDRNALVLVIEPNGNSRLRKTPEGQPGSNRTRSEYQIELQSSGGARIEGRTNVSGLAAPEYRRTYAVESTRNKLFEQGWARVFPGIAVKEVTVSDLTQIEKDVELTYLMEVPQYADINEKKISFFPFGRKKTSYVETYAPLSNRKHDLVMRYPWTQQFQYVFQAPKSGSEKWVFQKLPENTEETNVFGSYRIQYKIEEDKLKIEGEVIIARSRIPVEDYSEFRKFLGRIDRALWNRVEIDRAGAVRTIE